MARWDKLTSAEIAGQIAGGRDLAVLPVGATEQHGHHLATGTDTFSAELVAARAAERAGALVLPAIPYGCSHGHTEKWAGTLSLEPATLTALVSDIVLWAHLSGIRRFMVLSGHATNGPPIGSAILSLRYRLPDARFRYLDLWDISERLGQLYRRDAEDFHANRAETSVLLHAAPDMVRPQEIADVADVTPGYVFQYPMPRTTTNGVVGTPSEADPADGRLIVETAVDDFTTLLKKAMEEPWPDVRSA
ncbi:MAG: creatininase family protein [Roseitalea sp.]|jgi:creatinine amidohydrolase|uniref:creatininase family protein n=1 Tax=Oceaniradius stylonematis TaxID=2184161 RepID=UPI001B0DF57D|nr:creatininase family protein [Roseitalea sp.]MBO6953348.1 creatininase family protein [Rhizobiaceae bacterium]MBO6593695.1 creatininase family protein [Roseitalea sp.]MBO6601091.1 creatininase family protein [Roseitalea sp.]MBO6612772.1 creatininase family protein [Roseitalea sp.]